MDDDVLAKLFAFIDRLDPKWSPDGKVCIVGGAKEMLYSEWSPKLTC